VTIITRMPRAVPLKPFWTTASFVVYFGAFVVLGAAWWLLAELAPDGELELAGWGAVVAAALGGVAYALLRAERRIAAGLAALVALGAWAAFVGGLLDGIGLIPEEYEVFGGDFALGFHLSALLTAAAGAALVAWTGFPLLVLPTTVLLLSVAIDFATVLFGGGDGVVAGAAILFGLVTMAVALRVDAEARPYGFWVHLVAGAAIGLGVLEFWTDSDAEWILLALVSVAYVVVAHALERSSYAVLGALGLLAATTHFVDAWFGVPSPFGFIFGGEEPDTLEGVGEPLVYGLVGLGLVALGLVLERRRSRVAADGGRAAPVET
jgi:hypothetical protein